VVGCTTGSREVPEERKPVITDDDDDDLQIEENKPQKTLHS
jgi:hypothetical protein